MRTTSSRSTTWSGTILSGSHGNIGTRVDIDFQLAFIADLKAAIGKAMGDHPFSEFVDPSADAHTAFLANFFATIAREATDALRPKYGQPLRLRARNATQRRDGRLDDLRVPLMHKAINEWRELHVPIRALVVEEKDAPFEEQEIELDEPGRGEVLVRIVASGVCHTDAITRAGDMPMPFPSVLGHEGAGIVETSARA